MAETLVLANLTVDSSGVAGGINSANASLNQGQLILGRFGQAQTQVASTTSVVVGRLFSFRAVLLAVARSFGIVGIIIGLAAALKTLITDLITSTTWFKKASESVNDWYRSLVLGEGGVDRLMRKMKQASDGGATSLLEVFERFKKLGAQRTATEAAVAGLPFFDTVNLAIAKDDLVTINAEMIKLADRLAAANISRDALFKATGFQVGISASGLPAAAAPDRAVGRVSAFEDGGDQNVRTILDEMGLGVGVVERRLAEANQALQLFGANMSAFGGQARQEIQEALIDKFTSAGLTIDEINAKFQQFGLSAIRVTEDLGETLEKTNIKMDIMKAAAGAIAGAFTQAFSGDNISVKSFFADILNSMVPVFAAYGAMGLVRGFFGDATGFKIAAIAFPAAAAAALAARALGGGSSSSAEAASGAGGGDLGAVGGTGGGGTSVSVIVHGSLIGSSEDDLARSLERLLRTARGDGG